VNLYKYIQVLSIDVVAGACISTIYISNLLQSPFSGIVVTALGIAVWLIYTADHLWDAKKNEAPSTLRHTFHQRYFNLIFGIWIIVAIAGLLVLFLLPSMILKLGTVLLFVVIMYFLMLYFWSEKSALIKEFVIALLYTSGVFVSPIGLGFEMKPLFIFWILSLYFLLAFLNVLIFSIYDESEDRKDGHSSIVLKFGSNKVSQLTKILWFLGLLVLLLLGEKSGIDYYVFILMFSMLGGVIFFRKIFQKNEWYRVLGDGIFIMPIIPLIA